MHTAVLVPSSHPIVQQDPTSRTREWGTSWTAYHAKRGTTAIALGSAIWSRKVTSTSAHLAVTALEAMTLRLCLASLALTSTELRLKRNSSRLSKYLLALRPWLTISKIAVSALKASYAQLEQASGIVTRVQLEESVPQGLALESSVPQAGSARVVEMEKLSQLSALKDTIVQQELKFPCLAVPKKFALESQQVQPPVVRPQRIVSLEPI